MNQRGFPWIVVILIVLAIGAFFVAASTGVIKDMPSISFGPQLTPTPIVVVSNNPTPSPYKTIGPGPYADVPTTVGKEDQGEDSEWINGFNIRNQAQAKVKDAYRVYQSYVGDPVGPYEKDCQTFRFGKLCYDSTQEEPWHVSLDNLGLKKMQEEGLTPDATSKPHPALKAWMDEAATVKMTQDRLTGPVISSPNCRDGWCIQDTHRFRFVFPDGATKASEVRKAPLGQLSLPKPVAAPTPVVITVREPAPAPPPKEEGSPWGYIGLGTVILILLGLLAANLMNRGGIRRR